MSSTFEKVLILKNISIFEEASEMALSDLITVAEEKTYKTGDDIIRDGIENTYLYIILSGSVICTDKNGIVTELGPRQYFGETTVLCPAVIPYTIKANDKTIILRINGDRLYQMISLHPSIAHGFIGELSKRLRQGQFKNI